MNATARQRAVAFGPEGAKAPERPKTSERGELEKAEVALKLACLSLSYDPTAEDRFGRTVQLWAMSAVVRQRLVVASHHPKGDATFPASR
jgi:hypothetical protein